MGFFRLKDRNIKVSLIKNISLRYGLIAGVGTVAYFLLFYFINPRLMFSPWVSWSSLLLFMAGMWYGCKAFYEEQKERSSFRLYIREAFAVYVVANLVYYVFYYLLIDVFDPSLVSIQAEMGMESLERNKERLDPKQYEQIKETLENKDLCLKLNDVFLAFGNSAIGGFIIALSVAGIFNKSVEGN